MKKTFILFSLLLIPFLGYAQLSISGPSSAGAGSIINFSLQGGNDGIMYDQYVWEVIPNSGVETNQWGGSIEIYFKKKGEYFISCNLINSKTGQMKAASKFITIDDREAIIHSLPITGDFNIMLENQNE